MSLLSSLAKARDGEQIVPGSFPGTSKYEKIDFSFTLSHRISKAFADNPRAASNASTKLKIQNMRPLDLLAFPFVKFLRMLPETIAHSTNSFF